MPLFAYVPASRAVAADPAASATNAPAPSAEAVARGQFELGVRFLEEGKNLSAADTFQRTTELAPKFVEAYVNWAVALLRLGRESSNTPIRLKRFQEAAERLDKAAGLRPTYAPLYPVWGEALALTGDLPLDARDRLSCYKGAVAKYRQATQLNPKDWESFRDWGHLLTDRLAAFTRDQPALAALYDEAVELFGKAADHARFSSELAPVLADWGEALVARARCGNGVTERSKFLRLAIKKFELSAKTIPNNPLTYARWGTALADLAKQSEQRTDLRLAIEKFQKSAALDPTNPEWRYRRACAHALDGETLSAIDALEECFKLDDRGVFGARAEKEPDLVPLHGNLDYERLVRQARAEREMK